MATQCPKCQLENPDTAKFCSECAIPLRPSKDIGVTKTIITPTRGLQKGTTIAGKYQILEELGRGGMGVVCKAEDTKLKRTVRDRILQYVEEGKTMEEVLALKPTADFEGDMRLQMPTDLSVQIVYKDLKSKLPALDPIINIVSQRFIF